MLPSSKAAQAGLKMGDEIVRVNGLTLSQSTHEETVNLIKLKKTLTLTVRGLCKKIYYWNAIDVYMFPSQSWESFLIKSK